MKAVRAAAGSVALLSLAHPITRSATGTLGSPSTRRPDTGREPAGGPFQPRDTDSTHATGGESSCWRRKLGATSHTIELDDDLVDRMTSHLEEDETLEAFIEELVAIYEQEGRFLQEGP